MGHRIWVTQLVSRVVIAASVLACCAGAHCWTTPATIYTNGTGTTRTDSLISVVADSTAGTWGAAWTSDGPFSIDFGVLVSRTTNNGALWSAPLDVAASISTNNDSGDNPVLAASAAGTWIAAWDQSQALTTATTDNLRDIYFARSLNNGSTWAAPAALNSNAASATGVNTAPSLACDSSGNWVAVWQAGSIAPPSPSSDSEIMVARSSNNGASWSAASILNTNAPTDSTADWAPRVATDGSGTWITVWQTNLYTTSTKPVTDILFSKSTDNGSTWSPPVSLTNSSDPDSGYDDGPRIASSGAGTWIIVWASDNTLSGTLTSSGNIFYSRSTNSGGSFSTPAPLNSDAATIASVDAHPDIAFNSGGFVVTWDSISGGSQTDLKYSQSANGSSWSSAQSIGTPNVQPAYKPSLAAKSGLRMAGWVYGREGRSGDMKFSTDTGSAAIGDWTLYR